MSKRNIFLSLSRSGLATPLVLLALIVGSQYYFDIFREERGIIPPVIIPAQAIKLGNLGLHSASSALAWIYTVQQIAENPQKLNELIKMVNDLDPRFSYPYAFAAILLPQLNFTDQAIAIAAKGIKEADSDFRIPYYLATTYHIFLKDRKNAAFYFDLATQTPGANDQIKRLAARYGITKNFLAQTKEIWISVYETSSDEIIRGRAKNYIIHIEIIELLERAAAFYKQKYGFYPKKLEDLVSRQILKEIPQSPLGVNLYIRATGDITVE